MLALVSRQLGRLLGGGVVLYPVVRLHEEGDKDTQITLYVT